MRGTQERLRQTVPTMRVGVHQGKDGDVQRIPQLSHHQPAVDIWNTFPLNNTGISRVPGKSFGSHIMENRETHCNDDARGELCAEVIIQEPLKCRILLHDEHKLC